MSIVTPLATTDLILGGHFHQAILRVISPDPVILHPFLCLLQCCHRQPFQVLYVMVPNLILSKEVTVDGKDNIKAKQGHWNFGSFCLQARDMHLVSVKIRNGKTYSVKECAALGTSVISDSWRACSCFSKEGLQRLQVNQRCGFIQNLLPEYTQVILSGCGRLLIDGCRSNENFYWRLSLRHFAMWFPLHNNLFLVATTARTKTERGL